MKFTKKWQVVPYIEKSELLSTILQDESKTDEAKIQSYREELLKKSAVKEEIQFEDDLLTDTSIPINNKETESEIENLKNNIKHLEDLVKDVIDNKNNSNLLSANRPIAKSTRLAKKRRQEDELEQESNLMDTNNDYIEEQIPKKHANKVSKSTKPKRLEKTPKLIRKHNSKPETTPRLNRTVSRIQGKGIKWSWIK